MERRRTLMDTAAFRSFSPVLSKRAIYDKITEIEMKLSPESRGLLCLKKLIILFAIMTIL